MFRFAASKKMRLLYLLALFQLVAGPLVILQVSFLCKLAVAERGEVGLGAAFQSAWQSDEFQAVLQSGQPVVKKEHRSPSPASDPQPKAAGEKSFLIAWQDGRWVNPPSTGVAWLSDWSRRWTPIWPQAPPGPPPRVG